MTYFMLWNKGIFDQERFWLGRGGLGARINMGFIRFQEFPAVILIF